MKSFITWRLNFYRFKWWRRLAGIPELLKPAPSAAFVSSDNENYWRASPTAEVIPIRRPTPFKANQKDRYL